MQSVNNNQDVVRMIKLSTSSLEAKSFLPSQYFFFLPDFVISVYILGLPLSLKQTYSLIQRERDLLSIQKWLTGAESYDLQWKIKITKYPTLGRKITPGWGDDKCLLIFEMCSCQEWKQHYDVWGVAGNRNKKLVCEMRKVMLIVMWGEKNNNQTNVKVMNVQLAMEYPFGMIFY